MSEDQVSLDSIKAWSNPRKGYVWGERLTTEEARDFIKELRGYYARVNSISTNHMDEPPDPNPHGYDTRWDRLWHSGIKSLDDFKGLFSRIEKIDFQYIGKVHDIRLKLVTDTHNIAVTDAGRAITIHPK